MALESWLCLGGIELASACRTAAYAANGFRPQGVDFKACGCCGTADQWATAMQDDPYVSPLVDEAPWYAASEPYSADFGGFMITSIDGLGAGPITRTTTQRANGRGSFLGPAVQASPVVTVTGILFGKTCCSVGYGLRWLGAVLQGSCDSDCGGDTLTFLDCCPGFDGCAAEEPPVTPFDCLTPHLRYLEGVQLIQSPQILRKFGLCCGSCNGSAYMEIRFQLSATAPCVYQNPVTLASGFGFEPVDPEDCDITWVMVPDGESCPDETDCTPAADCLTGDCAEVTPPPSAPTPENPCICTPFNTRRAVVAIEAGSIPEFTEGVPVVRIYAGTDALRQVQVHFYQVRQDQTVDDVNPCISCGEVTLSGIPSAATFTFDGKMRKATITCPGADPIDATPLMGSRGGQLPIEWPEIACASSRFIMVVEAAADSVSFNSTVSLDIYPTECYSSAEAG